MTPLLQIQDLRVDIVEPHTDRPGNILRGVNLEVGIGEKWALVGESGCGKSMTALSILDLLPKPPMVKRGGRILFEDNDLDGLTPAQWREVRGKRIGMIFQEPLTSLNPVLTIGEQLMESLSVHMGQSREEARDRSLGLLREVGLPDPERILDHYPHQLSGGMCQRVMIAMSISCGPRLLIADEPTTALDVTVQAQILELLSRLTQTHGTAILLITHDLRIARDFSDRTAIFYFGQVVEHGPSREIFAHPAHPYTKGLLGAIPAGAQKGEALLSIPGSPPGPYTAVKGCSFADRCPKANERCWTTRPPWEDIGKGRYALCFYPSKT